MKRKGLLSALLLGLLTIAGNCRANKPTANATTAEASVTGVATANETKAHSIYIVVRYSEDMDDPIPRYTFWHDGLTTPFPQPANEETTFWAGKVTVSDGKAYVEGNISSEEADACDIAYYCDGRYTIVAENQAYGTARAIRVDDGKVMIAGGRCTAGDASHQTPTIWQKGNMRTLPTASYGTGNLSDFDEENDKIYAVGTLWGSDAKATPVCWTNNAISTLQDEGKDGYAEVLDVDDKTVYVAGLIKEEDINEVVVWKNGKILWRLGKGDYSTEVGSIEVNDGKVYVGGTLCNGADAQGYVWKNGKPMTLEGTSGKVSRVCDIAYDDGVVYAVGSVDGKAALWRNGKLTLLENINGADSRAVSIAIDD